MGTIFGQLSPVWLPVGTTLAATMTGGGLWFVVRLIVRYQRDFTNRYALRLEELELEKAQQDQRIEQLNRRLIACQTERGALRATVRYHGVPWEPSDYGAIDEQRGNND